jgi:tyrosyl-tRNA synthetase
MIEANGMLVFVTIEQKTVSEHAMNDIRNRGKRLTEVLIECGIKSKNEGRNLIRSGAIKLNNKKIVDENSVLFFEKEINKIFLIQFV